MTKQQLIEDNMALVYFIVNKHYPTFRNDQDIIQAGMLGLCCAAESWDEAKSKFTTYASSCILNAINTEFCGRKKHKSVLSLDYPVHGDDGEPGSFGDFCIGESDVDYVDTESFYDQLTERERRIVELKEGGVSVSDISKELRCSEKTVWATLRKLKFLWGSTNGTES